ncbi:MAG: sugar transferase [Miltoncostaeaceae bacterium]
MALASLAALVALPLFVAVAIAIVVESRGPVFYRAHRVGQHGREFRMLKFRKMHSDAAGPRLTQGDDERFTRVGRFLAKSKLDELPQLVNVLTGEMALVGPRPEDPTYVALYPQAFEQILTVPPGITGPAQLDHIDESDELTGEDFEHHYCSVILPRKLETDCHYVENRSTQLDLRILFQTIGTSLRRVANISGGTAKKAA